MFRFTCPFCSAGIRAKDEHRGTHLRCPRCREPLRVPSEEGGEVETDMMAGALVDYSEPDVAPSAQQEPDDKHELAASTPATAAPTYCPPPEPWFYRAAIALLWIGLAIVCVGQFMAMKDVIDAAKISGELAWIAFRVRAGIVFMAALGTVLGLVFVDAARQLRRR